MGNCNDWGLDNWGRDGIEWKNNFFFYMHSLLGTMLTKSTWTQTLSSKVDCTSNSVQEDGASSNRARRGEISDPCFKISPPAWADRVLDSL